jgi:choline dehydrogenase-like flavoprotein
MISDAITVPADTVLECDICIIGGGPAGISITREMIRSSKKIIQLESGGRKESSWSRDLLRGFISPSGSHEPLEENRRRQYGGASVAWGGRCVPLDPIDFEHRPWIPFSGWPLAVKDLMPYLTRATELCEAGRPTYDAIEGHFGQREMIAGFDSSAVISSALERWSPPTNFAEHYRPDIDRAPNVTVLLNATVVHLQLDQANGNVTDASVKTRESRSFQVRARHVVLACGGLENARLLLVSNDVARAGIGNNFDKVGRFYMSHLSGIHSWATVRDWKQGLIYNFERDGDVYVRRRFWITAETQRRERIGNAIACFSSPYVHESIFENALLSATYLAKFARGVTRSRTRHRIEEIRQNRKLLLHHIRVILTHAPSLVPQLAEVVRQRYFSKRRLPILLPRKEDLRGRYELYYQTEHSPNPQSRVILNSERDALGMPRLEARITFSDLDIRTVVQSHKLIKNQLRQTATGDLYYEEAELEEAIRHQLRNFNSAAHHIGTTRMSLDPIDGVVDRNCRVHGTENLFVVGSSVFPTSGHANPTLTIVALALRLAEHLKTL